MILFAILFFFSGNVRNIIRLTVTRQNSCNKENDVNLTKQIGINASAVLITDTLEENNPKFTETNRLQRTRGNEYGIVTIYRSEDIKDISNVLKRIIEEDTHG